MLKKHASVLATDRGRKFLRADDAQGATFLKENPGGRPAEGLDIYDGTDATRAEHGQKRPIAEPRAREPSAAGPRRGGRRGDAPPRELRASRGWVRYDRSLR